MSAENSVSTEQVHACWDLFAKPVPEILTLSACSFLDVALVARVFVSVNLITAAVNQLSTASVVWNEKEQKVELLTASDFGALIVKKDATAMSPFACSMTNVPVVLIL
jgi:hypothetical protein